MKIPQMSFRYNTHDYRLYYTRNSRQRIQFQAINFPEKFKSEPNRQTITNPSHINPIPKPMNLPFPLPFPGHVQ